MGCQLVLITNSKSHTGFQLVPTPVTLNDFERRNSPYFVLFHQSRQLWSRTTGNSLLKTQNPPRDEKFHLLNA